MFLSSRGGQPFVTHPDKEEQGTDAAQRAVPTEKYLLFLLKMN